MITRIEIIAIHGIPEVHPADDLTGLLLTALRGSGETLSSGDVVVVAQKVVSKAEGRIVALGDVAPGERALRMAAESGKDARLLEVVLGETKKIVRWTNGILICETHHGFICANAGVDQSNSADPDELIRLPEDPDRSARELRAGIGARRGVTPAVVVADSFGRAWRLGQVDVALGAAGLQPLDDWRGRRDARGRELSATVIAVADAVAAAADLARAKDSGAPVVLIRGLERFVSAEDGPGAAELRRPAGEDLFR